MTSPLGGQDARTILVTGGSGFVGLNIAAALLRSGERVVLFDPNGPPPAAERHLRALAGALEIETGDVRDGGQVARAIERHGAHRLVHAAAITAGLDRESTQARFIAEINLGGTIEVLEAALACGIERVVQLGTGSVFGTITPELDSIDEELTVPVPDSLYGITKYAAERTALRYRDKRGLDVVVGRLGVTFGRWEYDTGVRDTLSIPLQLLRLAEAGGFARFRRNLPDDWVYASDVAEAVVGLMGAPALRHGLYHIAGGRRWSIPDWCDRLKRHFPNFDYAIVGESEAVNIGATQPARRPPFAVTRLREDTGFSVRFREAEAFADHVQWSRETPAGMA